MNGNTPAIQAETFWMDLGFVVSKRYVLHMFYKLPGIQKPDDSGFLRVMLEMSIFTV